MDWVPSGELSRFVHDSAMTEVWSPALRVIHLAERVGRTVPVTMVTRCSPSEHSTSGSTPSQKSHACGGVPNGSKALSSHPQGCNNARSGGRGVRVARWRSRRQRRWVEHIADHT